MQIGVLDSAQLRVLLPQNTHCAMPVKQEYLDYM